MLKKRRKKDYSTKVVNVSVDRLTTIAQGTTVTGVVIVEGDIRLDGTVEGNIFCKGKVVIGPQGKVKGDIICEAAVLYGILQGDIHVMEELVLKPECIMNDDIYTCKLGTVPQTCFNRTDNITGKSGPVKETVIVPGKKTRMTGN